MDDYVYQYASNDVYFPIVLSTGAVWWATAGRFSGERWRREVTRSLSWVTDSTCFLLRAVVLHKDI